MVSARTLLPAACLAVLLALYFGATASAQDPSQFPGHGDDFHGFGPLGAEGLPISKETAKAMGFERKETALEVKLVTADGPAALAGLLPGDFIVATSLGPLVREFDPTAGPIIQLTLALEAAEVSKGKLSLLVRRAGKDLKITVEVEKLGAHSRTCPIKCEKCKALFEKSLASLVAMQNPDGSFPMNIGGSGGAVVVTTIAGLAMLSSGSTPTDGPYAEPIKKAAAFVMNAAGAASAFPRVSETGANWNQENWELAYAPWFLCEVFHRQPTLALKNRLKEIADRLIANMEASGGWAHGPGGPNALDYLELEIMSNYALTALGCMRAVGIEVDQAALDRARDYVVKECTTGDGGVAYSHRPGQKGNGDAGRTAGAYLGMARCDYQDDPMFAKMAAYFMRKDNLHTIPSGHVSPVMHFLAGAMASWESGARDFQTCWNTFRSTWRSFRQPDGIFTALPTEESAQLHSNSDRGCGPGWITASYTLIMGLHNDNLPVLLPGKKNGKPIKVEIPVITEAVESPQEPDR